MDTLKKKHENIYLIFDDSVDKSKALLKKYTVWDGIKNEIKAINENKENNYGKDYMKINSEDDFALKNH